METLQSSPGASCRVCGAAKVPRADSQGPVDSKVPSGLTGLRASGAP